MVWNTFGIPNGIGRKVYVEFNEPDVNFMRIVLSLELKLRKRQFLKPTNWRANQRFSQFILVLLMNQRNNRLEINELSRITSMYHFLLSTKLRSSDRWRCFESRIESPIVCVGC
jgi:hypothetical protein